MNYESKTLRSRPGLSQEEALSALQSHPLFKQGTRIQSIRKRGKIWVAEVLEPVTAAFPPSGGEESGPSSPPSDGPSDDSPASDDGSGSDDGSPFGGDGPDSPPSDGDSDKPKKSDGGGTDAKMLHVLEQILHALQGGEPEPSVGGPDDLGPDGPGGPDGSAGLSDFADSSAGAGSGPGAKLKPGEVPNRPGAVPLGSPAFASRQANPLAPGAAPGGPAGAPAAGGVTCPPGYTQVNGQCVPDTAGGTPDASSSGAPGLTAATYTVKRPDNGMTIKQAKTELTAQWQPYGYEVKRIVRENGVIRALVSKR